MRGAGSGSASSFPPVSCIPFFDRHTAAVRPRFENRGQARRRYTRTASFCSCRSSLCTVLKTHPTTSSHAGSPSRPCYARSCRISTLKKRSRPTSTPSARPSRGCSPTIIPMNCAIPSSRAAMYPFKKETNVSLSQQGSRIST